MLWTSRAFRALTALLALLLVVVGYWWWAGRARSVIDVPPPAGTSIDDSSPGQGDAQAPASTALVVVHVIGKVRRPGVVSLPVGSRVVDAVEAAGGIREGAHPGDLNLARTLVDGEQIRVGRSVPQQDGVASAPAASGAPLIDINTASATELESLPGVGPVLAGRIVAWRTDNGPFTAVDILGEVSGIGDVLLEQLRPLVRV